MVATTKEEGGDEKPKRGFGLGGFLPYRRQKSPTKAAAASASSTSTSDADLVVCETEDEPAADAPQPEDETSELPDFPSERRSHDGVVAAPSAAATAAAALRRRGMTIEQTATSLYRKMSVRQSSAPELQQDATSLTGSSDGKSPSPRSDPALKARRGACVATAYGTGTVLDVRLDDGFYVVQLVPKSVAYLREEAIVREIKSVVGERVKTRWGLATVEHYYVDEDMYSIALDWRWDDEHVWRMKATTKKFEKLNPRGTLMQTTKNRLFEGYSALCGSTSAGYATVVAKLNTTKSLNAGKFEHETLQSRVPGKAMTPFGLCHVLHVREADKCFVVQTPCGATAYLTADSVRVLQRRTHFADGERVQTPYGLGHVLRFRDEDAVYEIELQQASPTAQPAVLFMSDVQAEESLAQALVSTSSGAGASANARLSSILSLTRTSVYNASSTMRASTVSLPTLSSVRARVSSMATIKMTPKLKFQKDERVITALGSGFVLGTRQLDRIYRVYLRRLKIYGFFHEASLSPFPYERVTHFVVDGRTIPAPEIPRNSTELKRREVINAAIQSARDSAILQLPTQQQKPKQAEDQQEKETQVQQGKEETAKAEEPAVTTETATIVTQVAVSVAQ